MAGAKRDRQREAREARRAAEALAAKRAMARRRVVTVGISLVALVAVIFIFSRGKDDKKAVAAGSSTTVSTPGAGGSAAGKPCVAVGDPLPAGAPAIPVKVGPPPTSLVKEDLRTGTGADVTGGSTVTVNYIGVSCSTGKIFDSSYGAGAQPVTFPLSGVIKGWQEGIPGMKVGGQRLLGIPAAQAYGAAGQPPTIAPDEPLWFVVDVVGAK